MNHPLIPWISRWIHRPFFSSQIIRNLLLIPLLTSNQGLVKFEQFFLPRERTLDKIFWALQNSGELGSNLPSNNRRSQDQYQRRRGRNQQLDLPPNAEPLLSGWPLLGNALSLARFSEVGQRSCNLNGILGLHAIGQTKAINRAIQMPGCLLLIPNHQVIQALQTQLDRDDLMETY